jgi:hypothetical protein
MSKNNDYQSDTRDYLIERPGADLRLRLMTLKDLAHAFLEELGSVGSAESAGVERGIDFYDEVRRFEIELIQTALRHTGGVQTEAATLLGLKPTTLHAKLKQYQLTAAEFAARASDASRRASAGEEGGRGHDSDGSYRETEGEDADEGVPVLA